MQAQDRWDAADERRRSGQPVEAHVTEANVGGLIVGVMGFRAYLPGHLVTPDVAGDWRRLVGQRILVEILEVNRRRNRLIVRQFVPPAPP